MVRALLRVDRARLCVEAIVRLRQRTFPTPNKALVREIDAQDVLRRCFGVDRARQGSEAIVRLGNRQVVRPKEW